MAQRMGLAASAAKGFLQEMKELKDEAEAMPTPSPSSEASSSSSSRTSPAPGSKKKKKKQKNQKGPIPNYELPLSIVLYPDPRLRARNAKVTTFDNKLAKLARAMFDIMYR